MTFVITAVEPRCAPRAWDDRLMRIVGDKTMLLALAVGLVILDSRVLAAEVTWLLIGLIVSAAWGPPGRGRASFRVPAGMLGLISALLILLPPSAPLAPSGALMATSLLAAYDLAHVTRGDAERTWALGLAPAPVLAALAGRGYEAIIPLGALGIAIAVLLAGRTRDADEAAERVGLMRDDLVAKVRALEKTNARLSEALDFEPRAAALAERTRIARDIHDTVGHLLTRGVFQVNALRIVHSGDETTSRGLDALGATLDEAMTSMRAAVHALADEAEDVEGTLNVLAAHSAIPRTSVKCRIDDPPPAQVARAIIALTREALTNAERHGRAGNAGIRVIEYPAFWQISIENDGLVPDWRDEEALVLAEGEGLGVRSMRTRVEALGGRLQIALRPRFTVFATIPKEEG